MPQPPFAVTRDGELIQTVPLRADVRTGIDYNDARIELGLISEFEEREAASFAGIPWPTWMAMDIGDRAATVAHYRLHYLIEMHASDAASKAAKRKAKQAS